MKAKQLRVRHNWPGGERRKDVLKMTYMKRFGGPALNFFDRWVVKVKATRAVEAAKAEVLRLTTYINHLEQRIVARMERNLPVDVMRMRFVSAKVRRFKAQVDQHLKEEQLRSFKGMSGPKHYVINQPSGE